MGRIGGWWKGWGGIRGGLMKISEEIPQTAEGLRVYIQEAEIELNFVNNDL